MRAVGGGVLDQRRLQAAFPGERGVGGLGPAPLSDVSPRRTFAYTKRKAPEGRRKGKMRRVREWRLHVGAHKTATTHFQYTLEALRSELAEQGLDFLPLDDVRALRLPPSPGKRRWRERLGLPMRLRFEKTVAPLRLGPDRIAMSEENFLGLSRDLLGGTFYPEAERRLSRFAPLGGGRARLHVFLSIRSFDTLLPSAYVQNLRDMAWPGGFAAVKAKALDRPPSWTGLAERIRRALPEAPLAVWTLERYREHDREILSRFLGFDAPRRDRLPTPARTRSPSARGVAEMEALDPGMPHADRWEATGRIMAEDAARGGGERYAPFTDHERALLTEAYEEDLARLRRLLGEEGSWFPP